jgi:hypothetical protein
MEKRETAKDANFRFRARMRNRVDTAFEGIVDKLIENAREGQYNSAQILLRSIGVLDGHDSAGATAEESKDRRSFLEYLRDDLESDAQTSLAGTRPNA